MLKQLASVTGSGWKGYAAGIGLMLYSVVVAIQSVGIEMPIETSSSSAVELFLMGLAAFGIRSRMDH